MERKLGFIGAGNMAQAIIRGVIQAGICAPEHIFVSNRHVEKCRKLAEELGIQAAENNAGVVKEAEFLFLCVKPQMMEEVLLEIQPFLKQSGKKDQTIISIAAGKSISFYEGKLGTKQRIVRVMPNTPALCGEGMSAVCGNATMQEPENQAMMEDVLTVCRSFGEAVVVEERLIDVAGQVAGASPAWTFMVIEALADGAVACGMPRDMAYRFAAQGVAGAGKLMGKTGKHPGELKDMVTSPGGSTIQGVRLLEERGVRGAFMDAVIAAFERSQRM